MATNGHWADLSCKQAGDGYDFKATVHVPSPTVVEGHEDLSSSSGTMIINDTKDGKTVTTIDGSNQPKVTQPKNAPPLTTTDKYMLGSAAVNYLSAFGSGCELEGPGNHRIDFGGKRKALHPSSHLHHKP